ncbi:hypothetical protein HDU76_011196, partial [Blyttiomyces sp. JEL0837]
MSSEMEPMSIEQELLSEDIPTLPTSHETNEPEGGFISYRGFIQTTHDALVLFQAVRLGRVAKLPERINEAQKQMIEPGVVIIYGEVESGIKRWTDGKLWGPSRIRGNFLIYHQAVTKISRNQRQKKETAHISIRSERMLETNRVTMSGSKVRGTIVLMGDDEALIKKTISVV